MNIVSGVLLPFTRLYRILPAASKRGLPFVVIVCLIAAIFETASVASILPFMAVVMDPGVLFKYPWLEQALKLFNIETQQGAVIGAGVLTVAVLAIGNVVTAANLWIQTHYIALARRELSSELFTGYLPCI